MRAMLPNLQRCETCWSLGPAKMPLQMLMLLLRFVCGAAASFARRPPCRSWRKAQAVGKFASIRYSATMEESLDSEDQGRVHIHEQRELCKAIDEKAWAALSAAIWLDIQLSPT